MSITVLYEELEGSPTFKWNRSGGEGKRIFKIAWGDIAAFLLNVLPVPYLDGAVIVIQPPDRFPGSPWLFAQDADIEPWDPTFPLGTGGTVNIYAFAKVTVNYKTVQYDQTTFISHKYHVGGEFLTYPGGAAMWAGPKDPTVTPINGLYPPGQVKALIEMGVIIPTTEREITWHFVPYPPWGAMQRCIGHVNHQPFFGSPAETVLFQGVETSLEITNTGTQGWTLSYKFSQKNQNAINPNLPLGWNHFLRPDGQYAGQFQKLLRKIAGGASKLKSPIDAGFPVANVEVVSDDPFPFSGKFVIAIDNELMLVQRQLLPDGRAIFFTINRAYFGTAQAAHSVGALVRQVFSTQTSAFVSATAGVIPVSDATAFGNFQGQFYVQIENEVMAVLTVSTVTNNNALLVVRGVNNTVPASHNSGKGVLLVPNSIYQVENLNQLFLSGLVVG